MNNDMDLFRGLPTEFEDLVGASRRLNRLFDDTFAYRRNQSAPNVEVQETDEAYILACEMPGVPRENIRIETRGQRLYLWGEKRFEMTNRRGNATDETVRYEQILTLPQDVDGASVEADYRDGILFIAVPKGETGKRKQIEIGARKNGLLSKLKERVSHAIGGKNERAA